MTGASTPLDGSPRTTQQSDDTTSTTVDDQGSILPPGYQPPGDGPRVTGFGEGEAAEVVEDVREGTAGGGAGEWAVALVAVVVAGVALWVADRLIRSDRRRYMLGLASRQR